jgi:hypothetical protein
VKDQNEEALLGGGLPCSWLLSDLETSKTSTGSGKEEAKKDALVMLVAHIAMISNTYQLSNSSVVEN